MFALSKINIHPPEVLNFPARRENLDKTLSISLLFKKKNIFSLSSTNADENRSSNLDTQNTIDYLKEELSGIRSTLTEVQTQLSQVKSNSKFFLQHLFSIYIFREMLLLKIYVHRLIR